MFEILKETADGDEIIWEITFHTIQKLMVNTNKVKLKASS